MLPHMVSYFFFFFQAEDGIRDLTVTGVQTCALPISSSLVPRVVVTSPCVSPRVNSADPCARGKSPTSQEMDRTWSFLRPPMRQPSCVIIRRMCSYLRSSSACLTSFSLPHSSAPSAHSCATTSFLICERSP